MGKGGLAGHIKGSHRPFPGILRNLITVVQCFHLFSGQRLGVHPKVVDAAFQIGVGSVVAAAQSGVGQALEVIILKQSGQCSGNGAGGLLGILVGDFLAVEVNMVLTVGEGDGEHLPFPFGQVRRIV